MLYYWIDLKFLYHSRHDIARSRYIRIYARIHRSIVNGVCIQKCISPIHIISIYVYTLIRRHDDPLTNASSLILGIFSGPVPLCQLRSVCLQIASLRGTGKRLTSKIAETATLIICVCVLWFTSDFFGGARNGIHFPYWIGRNYKAQKLQNYGVVLAPRSVFDGWGSERPKEFIPQGICWPFRTWQHSVHCRLELVGRHSMAVQCDCCWSFLT